MSRTPVTVPVRIGAHRFELPADVLVGQHVRIRLPQAPIRDGVTGAVVGTSGTEWAEHLVRPIGSCRPDRDLEPDLWENAGVEDDGVTTSPHGVTICPECLGSWACDWQIELLLSIEGSGEN